MLITETADGPYPYAGVPWFSTAFGRDGIITALQMLWLEPALARGVLRYLAAIQATDVDPAPTPSPARSCTRCATARWRRSRDALRPLLRQRRLDAAVRDAGRRLLSTAPATSQPCLRALAEHRGGAGLDRGPATATATASSSTRGSSRPAWSTRAGRTPTTRSSTPTARLAEGPIALCEVQGYVYAARRARRRPRRRARPRRGVPASSGPGRAPAARFEEAFWCEELGTYGWRSTATSGPAGCRTSNAGHCLLHRHRLARSAPHRSSSGCWTTRCSPAGASARSRPRRPATTRCPTTTARSGRTTTR